MAASIMMTMALEKKFVKVENLGYGGCSQCCCSQKLSQTNCYPNLTQVVALSCPKEQIKATAFSCCVAFTSFVGHFNSFKYCRNRPKSCQAISPSTLFLSSHGQRELVRTWPKS